MSGWQIFVRQLNDAGGGPLPRPKFDREFVGVCDYAPTRAKRLGMVQSSRRGNGWVWTITQAGLDWCAGKVEFTDVPSKRAGRRRIVLRATWLMAHPTQACSGTPR